MELSKAAFDCIPHDLITANFYVDGLSEDGSNSRIFILKT